MMLLKLFLTFAKIGLFTFGGGYGMISLINRRSSPGGGWTLRRCIATSASANPPRAPLP